MTSSSRMVKKKDSAKKNQPPARESQNHAREVPGQQQVTDFVNLNAMEHQVASLLNPGNPRWKQSVQRQSLASQLGKIQGNRMFQQGMRVTEPGASTLLVVQRVDGPVRVRFGPYAPETYRNLNNIARTLSNDLERSIAEIEEGAPVRADAEEWISGIRAWLPSLQQRGDDPIDSEFVATQASLNYDELVSLRQRVIDYQQNQIVSNLRGAQTALSGATSRLSDSRRSLDDALRAAYMTQDESKIAQVSNFIGNALDIGLGIQELSRQMATAIADARQVTLPPSGRYTEMLGTVNRILAAGNLIYSIANMEAPTELGAAINQVNVLAGAFSAGTTLLSLSAHIGLYANLYLVPLVQIITTRLSAILDHHLHELNIVSAATGFPVEMSNEPGGWPMFNFIYAVMNASDSSGVPTPVPDQVESYMLSSREQLQAGTQEEMPTTGWWFWRDLDTGRIQEWVFQHRQRIWAMLYGSMPVPRAESLRGVRRQ